jgi:hypothetical protein
VPGRDEAVGFPAGVEPDGDAVVGPDRPQSEKTAPAEVIGTFPTGGSPTSTGVTA